MKTLSFLWRRLFLPAFAVYTLLTLSMMAFMGAVSGASEKPALTLPSALTLLFMALLIAASSLIFCLNKFSLPVKTVMNFFLTLASVVLPLLIGRQETGGNPLSLVILYSVIYLLFVPAGLLIFSIIKKKKSEDTDYRKVFSDEEE